MAHNHYMRPALRLARLNPVCLSQRRARAFNVDAKPDVGLMAEAFGIVN